MTTYRLDFGPEWTRGIVTKEPPRIGKPFVGRVPAVDEAGNDRAGIRLPEIAVPLATHTGWNYRDASIGAPDRLASEIGSYLPLPRTKADREKTATADSRSPSATPASRTTSAVFHSPRSRWWNEQYLLAEDVPAIIERARAHYEWATRE